MSKAEDVTITLLGIAAGKSSEARPIFMEGAKKAVFHIVENKLDGKDLEELQTRLEEAILG